MANIFAAQQAREKVEEELQALRQGVEKRAVVQALQFRKENYHASINNRAYSCTEERSDYYRAIEILDDALRNLGH